MKKLLIFLFTISIQLFFIRGYSQNPKIDSLKIVLNTHKEDTIQLAILKELCRETRKIGEFDKALEYGNKALIVGNNIINTSSNATKILVANNYLADVYNNIGIICWNQGNYDKAFEKYFLAIKIRENVIALSSKSNNKELSKTAKKGLAATYNNIGLIFESINNLEKAIENYTLSLKIQEEIMDKVGAANSYNNLGVIYYNKFNYEKALENYQIAKEIYAELNDQQGIASILSNEGIIFKIVKNYDRALENHLLSLKIRGEINDKIGVASSYSNLGSLFLDQNKIVEAKKYFIKSNEVSKEIGSKLGISSTYFELSKCDSALGNWKESLDNYKLYKLYCDSIFNEEGLRKSIEVETRFKTEKQEAQIKLLEKDKEKQAVASAAENKQQKAILLFILVVLLLVIVFSVFMSNRFRVTQKQKKQIEEQKIITEHQKNLVEEKNKEITDSIHYAKRIQAAILPRDSSVKEHLRDSFIIYKPKDIVAGDFYWMEHNAGTVLFAAADCTGHGVPGAMVSVVCNNAMNRSVREYGLINPGDILNKTREIVIQEFEKSEDEVKDGMDIALCSLEGNILKYAGANNPLWIIRKGATEIEEIKADKQPIGKYIDQQPFTTHSIEIQKGDSIYIFSDGYTDQFGGEKGKKFKAANFKKLLLSIQNETIEKQKILINDAFENWKGELEQLDDVCIIGIKI